LKHHQKDTDMIFVKNIAALNAALEAADPRLSLKDFQTFLKDVIRINTDFADAAYVLHVSSEDLRVKRVIDLRTVLPLELVGAIEPISRALRLGNAGAAESTFEMLGSTLEMLGSEFEVEVTFEEDDCSIWQYQVTDLRNSHKPGVTVNVYADTGYMSDACAFLGAFSVAVEVVIKERNRSLTQATDDFLSGLVDLREAGDVTSDMMAGLPIEMKKYAYEIRCALDDQDLHSAGKLRNKLIGSAWLISGANESRDGLFSVQLELDDPEAGVPASRGLPSRTLYTSMIGATLRAYAANLIAGRAAC
jgi:hypothetical protein